MARINARGGCDLYGHRGPLSGEGLRRLKAKSIVRTGDDDGPSGQVRQFIVYLWFGTGYFLIGWHNRNPLCRSLSRGTIRTTCSFRHTLELRIFSIGPCTSTPKRLQQDGRPLSCSPGHYSLTSSIRRSPLRLGHSRLGMYFTRSCSQHSSSVLDSISPHGTIRQPR